MTRYFAVTIRQPDGTPIPGALVCVNDRCATTGENGRARIDGISGDWHQVQLQVEADGFQVWSESVNLDPALPVGDVDWTDLYLTPEAPAPLLRLDVAGTQLVTEDGQPWTWRGCSDFLLYKRFLDGQDILPIILERRALGANLLRVFGMCHYIAQFEPATYGAYFESLRPFAELLQAEGLYLEFAAFADAQMLIPALGDQQAHFARVCEALQDAPNVVLELCNEYPKNGIEPRYFSAPAGILASAGSALADAPPGVFWDFFGWHGRRDYPKVTSSCEDMYYVIQQRRCPGVHDEPMGFAEVDTPNRRSTDPRLAAQLALTSVILGSGATFHSDAGLYSESFGPVQAVCAAAFFEALR